MNSDIHRQFMPVNRIERKYALESDPSEHSAQLREVTNAKLSLLTNFSGKIKY